MRGAVTGGDRATGSSSAPGEFGIPANMNAPAIKAGHCWQSAFMINNLSEHFIPRRALLEHRFAQQAERRHAVAQHFVMELLQRVGRAFLLLVVPA